MATLPWHTEHIQLLSMKEPSCLLAILRTHEAVAQAAQTFTRPETALLLHGPCPNEHAESAGTLTAGFATASKLCKPTESHNKGSRTCQDNVTMRQPCSHRSRLLKRGGARNALRHLGRACCCCSNTTCIAISRTTMELSRPCKQSDMQVYLVTRLLSISSCRGRLLFSFLWALTYVNMAVCLGNKVSCMSFKQWVWKLMDVGYLYQTSYLL